MTNYIETKVSYLKEAANGKMKKVNDVYLIVAPSFADAENRAKAKYDGYSLDEFKVAAVKKCDFGAIINGTGDKWWRVKINVVETNEKTGEDKKKAIAFLVQGYGVRTAIEGFDKYMRGDTTDYEISAVTETAILEILTEEDAHANPE